MAANEKPSVSGLMDQSHEVSRFENLVMKSIDTAYYNPSWGLDWEFWLNDNNDYPLSSLASYVTQESMLKGIVVQDINLSIADFTLQYRVIIEGITLDTKRDLT